MIRRAIVFLALILATLGLAPAARADTFGTLVITTDTKLKANHDGNIVIDADNVALNCAGHVVSGPGDGFGILIQNHTGVLVKNCQVTGFLNGFVLLSSSTNTLVNNTATGCSGFGFVLVQSVSNRLIGNTATASGLDGFDLQPGSATNLLASNGSFNNLGDGFDLIQSPFNTIKGNTASSNARGFEIGDSSDSNVLAGNRATGNQLNGFLMYAVSNNRLTDNVSSANGRNGFILWGSLGEPFPSSRHNKFSLNIATNNGINGFALHGSADSPLGDNSPTDDTYVENSALGNAEVGFYLSTDDGPTVGNRLRENVACTNIVFDAKDENGFGDNIWKDNSFCTSDLPQPSTTIDFTTHGVGVFDPLTYQSDGLVFPPQRCGLAGCDSWFVGFLQGDEALVLTPLLGPITGTFTDLISTLSMQIAPASQGTATYTLTAFNGSGQIVATRSLTVTQDSGDPQSGPPGYFTLSLGQLPAPATSFELDDVFVRSTFGINQIECGVSSITFASS